MQWFGGVRKNFQLTDLSMPNNVFSMKCDLQSVPGLADAGVPHGVDDGPIALAPGARSKNCAYHVVQHEKLKELGRSKAT